MPRFGGVYSRRILGRHSFRSQRESLGSAVRAKLRLFPGPNGRSAFHLLSIHWKLEHLDRLRAARLAQCFQVQWKGEAVREQVRLAQKLRPLPRRPQEAASRLALNDVTHDRSVTRQRIASIRKGPYFFTWKPLMPWKMNRPVSTG